MIKNSEAAATNNSIFIPPYRERLREEDYKNLSDLKHSKELRVNKF